MNSQTGKMEERCSMSRFEDRIKTFQEGVVLQKKKLKWSFKVIPYQAMAKLGFYFDPVVDLKTSQLKKDSVKCCYCHRRTYNVRDCRSKKKDVLETLSNIMRKHLSDPGKNQICLQIYLRNKLLTDYSFHMGVSDWKSDKYFSDPDDENVLNYRRFTFENNWPYDISQNEHRLGIESMVNAGFIRYDTSIEGLSDPDMDKALMNDACYCIYCKHCLQGWSLHDDPVKRHYEISQNGNCHFFQTRNRFENIRKDKDIVVNTSGVINQNDQITAIPKGKEEKEVIAVESTSQSQTSLVRLFSPGNDPQTNGNDQSDNSVIQHNISVLNETEGKNAKQNNIESGDTTLGGDKLNQDILVDEKDVILTPVVREGKRKKLQAIQLSSPIGKRRKFKRISPRRIFDEESNENSYNSNSIGAENKDKDLVIDFTSHINKTRDIGRKNAILDDSTDEFSFSNQGHSTFDIPIPSSSHLVRDTSSDNKNVTRENTINANADSKEAELYLAKDSQDGKTSDTELIGGEKNTNILEKTQVADQKQNDRNADKYPFNRTQDSPEIHELNEGNVQKAEVQIENPRQNNGAIVPIRQSPDAIQLSSNSNSIADDILKGELDVNGYRTSNVKVSANADLRAEKEPVNTDSLSSNEPAVPGRRKLDNIKIDLSLSASDFSPSSSKCSSAISTPVASPKISLTRSLHAARELSGFEKEQLNDKDFTNKQSVVSVKNETPEDRSPIFETGTPIETQESKPRNLFDDDFLGKGLDTPIYSSTVEINEVPKLESVPVPLVAGLSTSDTSLQQEYSRLKEQKQELNTYSANASRKVSGLNEDTEKIIVDSSKWREIDENRLLVKNYFHDLLKYINNNDATLSNDKDGDLAFLIKQMPNEELDMTFINWVNLKVQSIEREFIDDCDKKLEILRNDFNAATTYVKTLEDDDELIEIAKNMGIL